MELRDNYVDPLFVKVVLTVIAAVTTVLMALIRMDDEFRISFLLPMTYLAITGLWINPHHINGIGRMFLLGCYCLRMCLFPLWCAFGNFYMGHNTLYYKPYFTQAILLQCIECCIVLGSLRYYSKFYGSRQDKFRIYSQADTHGNNMLYTLAKLGLLAYGILFLIWPNFLTDHYRFFITKSIDEEIAGDLIIAELLKYSTPYYAMVMLDIYARPIMIYVLIDWLLQKGKPGFFLSLVVGMNCMLWVTDMRFLTLVTGLVYFIYILRVFKNKTMKAVVCTSIASLVIMIFAYAFFGLVEPQWWSWTLHRYFSMPGAVSLNIGVYMNYLQTPYEFFRLLWNNFMVLNFFFGRMPRVPVYSRLYSGQGVWTPALIGAIQYFHLFGFLMIIPPVKMIVYADYASLNSRSHAEKLMMNFLTINMSVFMINSTIELIYYNLIAKSIVFFLALWINRHFELVNWSTLKYFRRCRYKDAQ